MNRRDFVRLSAQLTAGPATLALLQACGGGGDPTGATVVPALAVRNAYRQTNLAATKPSYSAPFTFPDMVDAWGIAIRPAGAGGHFWVLGGGTSWQFVGDVSTSADPKFRALFQDGLGEVYLPGADALTTNASAGKSTGTAFNGAPINSDHFRVTAQTAAANGVMVAFDGSARFVFVTDSGRLSAWTDRARDGSTVRVNGAAQLMYDGSALGMSMFGVAIKTDTWDTLWTVDFGTTPQVRQFDKAWQLVPTQGFANPFVRVYDDAGRLNAPWGVALAPADFGPVSNALLVGNFGGAGKIAAFNQTTGRFIDYLRNEAGQVIGLDGTWALMFGNGVSLGDANALYFAAGPEGETAGLFGSLRYAG